MKKEVQDKETRYKKLSEMLRKHNTYDLSGECGKGFIKDKTFLFDKTDFDLIKKYCWYIDNKGYVKANIRRNGKPTTLRLHRLIMKQNDTKVQIDHINHDKLNNQKSNLRICSNAQNNWNKGKQSNNTSGVVGVCYLKNINKWYARITVNGKTICLGVYDDLQVAKQIRENATKKYFGEYCYKGDFDND